MKLLKSIICVLIVISIGFVISSAEINKINWINQFTKTFESTGANFKFYNIKANAIIYEDINMKNLEKRCLDLINNINIDKNKIDVKRDKNKVFVNYNDKNTSILVTGVKKSERESHIVIDILNNKVYKNIENNYQDLKNKLDKDYNRKNINLCIAGEYTKRLQKTKISDILQKILYNMYAKEIDNIEDENFLSINAYSKLLKENNIDYLYKEMNLNIGIRYSEDDDRTIIYIATPIIKIDY